MAKVIGFNGKIGKSVRKRENGKLEIRVKTAAELINDPFFIGACRQVAERKEIPVETLATKRQASKFFRGTGLVYNTIMVK